MHRCEARGGATRRRGGAHVLTDLEPTAGAPQVSPPSSKRKGPRALNALISTNESPSVSQVYERELKGILMADAEVLKRVVAHLPPEEQLAYMRVMEKPFVVVRAAGSLGVDMAVVGVISFLVEEKTSVEDVYHFSKPRIIEQAEHLKSVCSMAGVTPVYAYRLKRQRARDPWRLFTIEMDAEKLDGYQRLFYSRLPKLEYTRSNNYVMRWESGWPLHKFIDWVASLHRSGSGSGG